MSKEKKYRLNTELTLQEVLQLQLFTGSLANMSKLYYECKNITNYDGNYEFYKFCKINNFKYVNFQEYCKNIAIKKNRKTIVIGDKTYYEDELAQALANIEKVK